MRRILLLVVASTVIVAGAAAVEGLSLVVTPGVAVPLGTSATDYSVGGGADLSVAYRMPFAPILFAGAGIGYLQTRQSSADVGVSLLSIDAQAGLDWAPTPRLTFRGFGAVGWGQGILAGGQGSGGSLFWRAGAGFDFGLGPRWNLGFDADYRQYVSQPDPLWQGIFIGLTVRYEFGTAATRPRVKVREVELLDVYPVLYGYYETNPVGSLTLINDEPGFIEEARVNLFVRRYMDEPVTSAEFPRIERDEVLTVPLYALFSDEVMTITEGDKAAVNLTVSYLFQGQERVVELSDSMEFQNRNALSWDDDRKAAAFVTAKDPAVLRFSKGITGDIREAGDRATARNFRIALGLFQGLSAMGIDYVIDPQSAYAEFAENAFAVDYLQFPGQTMAYQGGDCDDLTVLYAALLESVGIETAMIPVPGHIYFAFALDISPEEARRLFPGEGEVIIKEGKAWVPVEVTLVRDGFLTAWIEATKDWAKNDAAGVAAFLPVRESWLLYPPVGGSDVAGDEIDYPSGATLMAAYDAEMEKVIRLQISAREEELKRNIQRSNESPKHVNRLGLLYARFGLMGDAREVFARAAAEGYAPAMVNLGNLAYLKKDYPGAETAYRRALEEERDNPKALLGLARAQYENRDYAGARQTYDHLELENPQLAERYAFLSGETGTTARAADDSYRQTAEWDEE